MEHPFLNKADLKEMSTEQLQEQMASLTNKLTFAYRTGNGPLIHQLQMVLETYRNQFTTKMDELFEKQNIKNKINIESDNK
jgi:hypothetical protein